MKLIILIIFLGLGTRLTAQANLVLNPSFEDTLQCPDFHGQINRVKHWSSPTNTTPDIISSNFCNVFLNSNDIDSPQNYWGFQNPKTGNNYAGIGLYTNNTGGLDREYIQGVLNDSLKYNVTYCVSFYISLSDYRCHYAVKDIGVYFSNDSVYEEGEAPYFPILNFTPKISNSEIISDTTNWVRISGFFKATGGEKYLIIGCFEPQLNVDTLLFNPAESNKIAYYYIDDVSLYECDSLVSVSEERIEPIKIYPNPAQDFVSIELPKRYNQAKLNIYNLTGQLISQKQITQPNQQIPITELGNGMYIFVIQNEDRVIGRQRVVVAR